MARCNSHQRLHWKLLFYCRFDKIEPEARRQHEMLTLMKASVWSYRLNGRSSWETHIPISFSLHLGSFMAALVQLLRPFLESRLPTGPTLRSITMHWGFGFSVSSPGSLDENLTQRDSVGCLKSLFPGWIFAPVSSTPATTTEPRTNLMEVISSTLVSFSQSRWRSY